MSDAIFTLHNKIELTTKLLGAQKDFTDVFLSLEFMLN